MSRELPEWVAKRDDDAIPPRVKDRVMPKGCDAPGCAKAVRSSRATYCEAHYYRLRRGSKAGLGPINKACLNCEMPLTKPNASKYCSYLCTTRHRRGTPSSRICLMCKSEFATWERAAVCSPKCRKALRRTNEHSRRAKIRNLPRESFSAEEIFKRDRWICQLCGKKTNRSVHPRNPDAPSLDHILPIKHGGGHTRVNTQCTHLMCNFRKQGRAIGQLRLFG